MRVLYSVHYFFMRVRERKREYEVTTFYKIKILGGFSRVDRDLMNPATPLEDTSFSSSVTYHRASLLQNTLNTFVGGCGGEGRTGRDRSDHTWGWRCVGARSTRSSRRAPHRVHGQTIGGVGPRRTVCGTPAAAQSARGLRLQRSSHLVSVL